ncbi:protein phosphatase regulator [Saccharomycopsis crataegensis]|uniref:Protein phosphatase regulator n=1 Tax=Saccharomycopsis crataegensis TaxID=43959 RepID=A0AAV5QIX6_9ASCO|nr:protein phosphatase regulator [Saccharomycopsis crataegensis]
MSRNTDKKFKTFRDLNRGDDSSDNEDEKNLFTGGERSGLEVEKPPEDQARSLVQQLLNQAARSANLPDTRPGAGQEPSTSGSFAGSGYRLGTENATSEVIPGQQPSQSLEKVTRTCTFWKDGFSIDDGPLYRFDDPKNKSYMEQMRQGNAPLDLFRVMPGQSVDINLKHNSDQNYKPPKSKQDKFSGEGFRLGSPVPGDVITDSSRSSGKEKLVPESSSSSSSSESNKDPNVENENKTTIQVRLADGRKLKVVVDKHGPVQQVYDFVDAIFLADGETRSYFLSLSYPVKPINDKVQTISDAKLVHSVVIQRWK